MPHPHSMFSLLPVNEAAEAVVNDPNNSYLRSQHSSGIGVLDVGHYATKSNESNVFATMGRDADITVVGAAVSKIHCQFEIIPATQIVMLRDMSASGDTQVLGETVFPFQKCRRPAVVISNTFNTGFSIGLADAMIEFRIIWPEGGNLLAMATIASRTHPQEHPQRAQTVLLQQATVKRITRIHGASGVANIRVGRLGVLGSGSFGVVFKGVNVDNGDLFAVKSIKTTPNLADKTQWDILKREIETMGRIFHPNIVEYFGSEGWMTEETRIYMGLKEGTLGQLAKTEPSHAIPQIAKTVLRDMLKALDYLAVKGLVHRDIKPENILYERTKNTEGFHFFLGDLGLCNNVSKAVTVVGTPMYVAPEIMADEKQTSKADIWSLFVTILWTLDSEGFRSIVGNFHMPGQNRYESTRHIILDLAATNADVAHIREMARLDPVKRASAAQMLVKCFNGEGLTTRRHLVTPISPSDEEPHSTSMATTTATPASGNDAGEETKMS